MDDLEKIVEKHQDGAIFNIFVTTSSQNTIFPSGYDEWRKTIQIKVCSPAKDNKANLEVLRTVADFFDKSTKDVFIISGGKNKEKKILIKKMSTGDVVSKLQEYFNEL